MMKIFNHCMNDMKNNLKSNIISQKNQQNYKNIINLIFERSRTEIYSINTNYNEALNNAISKYIDLAHDYDINLYIHNGKMI